MHKVVANHPNLNEESLKLWWFGVGCYVLPDSIAIPGIFFSGLDWSVLGCFFVLFFETDIISL